MSQLKDQVVVIPLFQFSTHESRYLKVKGLTVQTVLFELQNLFVHQLSKIRKHENSSLKNDVFYHYPCNIFILAKNNLLPVPFAHSKNAFNSWKEWED